MLNCSREESVDVTSTAVAGGAHAAARRGDRGELRRHGNLAQIAGANFYHRLREKFGRLSSVRSSSRRVGTLEAERAPRRWKRGCRPVPAVICVRHENPSATSSVSAAAARPRASRTARRSASTSYCSPAGAERPGHPAAARLGHLCLDAGEGEQAASLIAADHRLVVAVAVDQRAASDVRRGPSGRVASEQLVEHHRLGGEQALVLVVGHLLAQLVAEHLGAARLKHEHRDAGFDRLRERLEDVSKGALGECEHPEIVQRPSAAQVLVRHSTANPAASSTSTAALPASGSNRSVNVSGHSTTRWRPAARAAPGAAVVALLSANQSRKRLCLANFGISSAPARISSHQLDLAARSAARRWSPLTSQRPRRDLGPTPWQQAERIVVVVGGAWRSSGRGTRPCRSGCRPGPGSRWCTCTTGNRSSDSLTASSRQPSVTGSPLSISNSRRERPRVECRSSRVAWKLGHIVRLPRFRHLAIPEARPIAVANEPPSGNEMVFSSGGR